MAQSVTLGGDRIGSGKKQQVELHDYEMTSFNLEQDFKSSMAAGILYPFIKLIGTNHDTFDIDTDSFVRTLPTKGPLFGSFKLQADIYICPVRLYQGILHNNPLDIGLKTDQILFPKIKYTTTTQHRVKGSNDYNYQVNESSLMKYLGFSGAGRLIGQTDPSQTIQRKINAIPFLAYYDIFKTYYANKQEENAYVITPGNIETKPYFNGKGQGQIILPGGDQIIINPTKPPVGLGLIKFTFPVTVSQLTENPTYMDLVFEGSNLQKQALKMYIYVDGNPVIIDDETLEEAEEAEQIKITRLDENIAVLELTDSTISELWAEIAGAEEKSFYIDIISTEGDAQADIQLTSFPLKNIDKMRYVILSNNELNSEVVLEEGQTVGMPYEALVAKTTTGISYNAFIDNGLVVKTYQSDLFNNWLNTEYIEGQGGIADLTAVSVSSGKFLLDSLNLAEKMYELYNRIIVSGGTWEDYQDAVYGEGATRKAETPIYVGGMSAEIMFEEVIASTEATTNDQKLGSLAGKGTQVGKNGGNNIHIKCEEPSYIIGIVSITPRIAYSQGNDWDLTELNSVDDLHKPQLDGIGFQDLIVEQMAWWDTGISAVNPLTTPLQRSSAGKQTAWINYQTAVDKVYGDFARADGYAFMALNRNYEKDPETGKVKDITTYIDPAKFNYAFAVADLASQNFWVQIHSKVIARRKMAAQQIPNL